MKGSTGRVYRHIPSDRSWEALRDMIKEFKTALVGDAGVEEEITDEEWQRMAASFWSEMDTVEQAQVSDAEDGSVQHDE